MEIRIALELPRRRTRRRHWLFRIRCAAIFRQRARPATLAAIPSPLLVLHVRQHRPATRAMPDPYKAQCSAFAAHLEQVLLGQTSLASLDDLLESPGPYLGEALQSCYHGLQHYLMDEHIRAKDPRYRRLQENEMKRLIRLLREGAAPERLSRISFLSTTTDIEVDS